MTATSKAILIGGGIGSLAAAAFLIRDGAMRADRISILECASAVGGALDAAGDPAHGYSMRGGRMFTTDNYECTWSLFKTIPSLSDPHLSVFDEISAFNRLHASHAHARLVNRQRGKIPVISMGLSMDDRLELLELSRSSEHALEASRITDWLSPAFFATPFWLMWSTTFAFQPWHSAVEFKRYLHRFILEFSRIDTLAGVKRTPYNQFDSLVRPLLAWLIGQGVQCVTDCRVTALDHAYVEGEFLVTGIQCLRNGRSDLIAVGSDDFVFLQNGSMTDASSIGSMTEAPAHLTKTDGGGWSLWESLARIDSRFGNPAAFNDCVAQSWWGSFTVTLSDRRFFDAMRDFSGNEAGTGGLVTFKDSNWLLSIVLPHQPHFLNQPDDAQVFWGYSLFGDRIGDYVAKPMAQCSGGEILTELRGHLRFDPALTKSANCIPCRMPYITSMFMPRRAGERPPPVPAGSKNLAFISQFVEIPEDVVFTVEYSIRAAQMAVYGLLAIERPIPPVTPHDHSMRTEFAAVLKAFK